MDEKVFLETCDMEQKNFIVCIIISFYLLVAENVFNFLTKVS